ncbi:MAG: RNA polymerase sigma factor [Rikenellaceae bacterium]
MIEDKIIELLADTETCYKGFQLLVETFKQPIYWHIRRLIVVHEDAEDVMQECFIKIYRYIYTFKGESSLKTWIYRIVTNEVIRHLSRKRLSVESYNEKSRLVEIFASDGDLDFQSAQTQLHMALLALPDKQRIVFNLRYFDDMSYEQISEITGSSILTLRTNYHYASEKIKVYVLNNIK